jgi:hypothetical protein
VSTCCSRRLTSSLFPHLPQRSRTPFRIGLIVIVVALAVFATLRLPAALITVAALGVPVLFLIYLRESDVVRDLPISTLLLTAVLGIGLGVAWVMLTGAMVARSYGVPLGAGVAGYRMLREGLGVPLGSLILMLLPAVVVRIVMPGKREALDGFIIGAFGALTFTAAASLARLAPQFATGLVARACPVSSLLIEAGIHGLAVPGADHTDGRASSTRSSRRRRAWRLPWSARGMTRLSLWPKMIRPEHCPSTPAHSAVSYRLLRMKPTFNQRREDRD